jgi:uncharacterized protein YjbI with pentapeptide repeats
MSEQQYQPAVATATTVTAIAKPHGEGRSAWRNYWRAQNQVWRTEPEIDAERQTLLVGRRAIKPDVSRGVYPFTGMQLTRGDVEWLLATHEDGRGPVDWSDEAQRNRPGLDLRGARLSGLNLRGLPLANMIGGLTGATPAQRDAAQIKLVGADLRDAHLEGAYLREAALEDAKLDGAHATNAEFARAHMNRASLRKAHLECATFRNAHMQKVNLNEANLEAAELSGARIEGSSIVGAHLEAASLGGARLQAATLRKSHMEGTRFFGARLDNASLSEAYLYGAQLRRAHLEGVDLSDAHLEATRLAPEDLARIRQWQPDMHETLAPADMCLAYLDSGTVLEGATLGNATFGHVSLADVRWGDVNLSVVRWTRNRGRGAAILGDERIARKRRSADGKAKDAATRLRDFEAAVRANRQLAVALRAQGLDEDAAAFAYRAQVLQREVLLRQLRFGAYSFSLFLDLLAGYGYRPGRSLVVYLLVIFGFAATYYTLGQSFGPQVSQLGALVFSVTSFHGRGFFPGTIGLDDPLTVAAAVEAIIGLIIEISFIATFTQRFFGK